MGMHACAYCQAGDELLNVFSNSSSGDVVLVFSNGNSYIVPDMITHYVHDHGWKPPQQFIDDVMTEVLVGGERFQTKSASTAPTEVGYLRGAYEVDEVPEEFIFNLMRLIRQATEDGNRRQTR